MVCLGRPPYVTGRAVRGASPEGETAQEAQPGGVGPDVDPDDSTAPELTIFSHRTKNPKTDL